MRVFILEDDMTRILYFRERLMQHDLTIVSSCAQIDQFQPPYDVVFFDHDLGGRQMTAHVDNGAAFARAVADRIGDATVLIHSYNGEGAMRIKHAVGGFYVPFRGPSFDGVVDEIFGSRGRAENAPVS